MTTLPVMLDRTTHTYTVGGVRVQSVGQLVKSVTPAFDCVGQAALYALKRGWTPAEVLGDWDRKRDEACALGHDVHAFILKTVSGNGKLPSAKLSVSLPYCGAWLDWWNKSQGHLHTLALEQPVADLKLGLAGTPDHVARSSKNGKVHVLDYKTNANFRHSNDYHEYLLPPFQDLPNCEHSTYSLQVSLYSLLLERQFGEPLGAAYLVHVKPDGVDAHVALDLRARAEAWLSARKRAAAA